MQILIKDSIDPIYCNINHPTTKISSLVVTPLFHPNKLTFGNQRARVLEIAKLKQKKKEKKKKTDLTSIHEA